MALSSGDVIPLSQARAKLSEHIYLLLMEEAGKGLADIAAGNMEDARDSLAAIKRRRASRHTG